MLRKQYRPVRGLKCPFCQSGKNPDYKKVETLMNYLTDRGKIISRGRTGICARHQRRLAREVKRARHLALLSFITKI